MAHKAWIPKRRLNPAAIAGVEKHLLQKHYGFVQVKTTGGTLTCIGYCTPSDVSITYTYKIKYSAGSKPKVYTLSPKIEYQEDIHMYPQDNSLCLHYPKDYSWTPEAHLYDTIIPWTHEWFVFYELYQIYGVWMHPAVPHKNVKQLF